MDFSEIDPDCMVAEDIIRYTTEQLSEVYFGKVGLPDQTNALGLLTPIAEALLSMPAQERMDILEALAAHNEI